MLLQQSVSDALNVNGVMTANTLKLRNPPAIDSLLGVLSDGTLAALNGITTSSDGKLSVSALTAHQLVGEIDGFQAKIRGVELSDATLKSATVSLNPSIHNTFGKVVIESQVYNVLYF